MIGYSCGSWDILRRENLENLSNNIRRNRKMGKKYFAVGIYHDSMHKNNPPLKPIEDRMKIMKYIKGVDFVFPVYDGNRKNIQQSCIEAFIEF